MRRLASLAALACAGFALGAAKPGEPAAPKICRAAEASIGSHIKRAPTCRTEAEWKALEEAHRAAPLQTKAPQPEAWERTRPQ
ncbi:MAG TPA: hypothetical protein VGD66_15720 [Allosphingosinicella sp.]|jgi:hypothetical protein